MQFEGALIKEQQVVFAVVIVKPFVLDSSSEMSRARKVFSRAFPGVPIILMAQDGRGVARYQGRRDIVDFLCNVELSRIPWKKYTLN